MRDKLALTLWLLQHISVCGLQDTSQSHVGTTWLVWCEQDKALVSYLIISYHIACSRLYTALCPPQPWPALHSPMPPQTLAISTQPYATPPTLAISTQGKVFSLCPMPPQPWPSLHSPIEPPPTRKQA